MLQLCEEVENDEYLINILVKGTSKLFNLINTRTLFSSEKMEIKYIKFNEDIYILINRNNFISVYILEKFYIAKYKNENEMLKAIKDNLIEYSYVEGSKKIVEINNTNKHVIIKRVNRETLYTSVEEEIEKIKLSNNVNCNTLKLMEEMLIEKICVLYFLNGDLYKLYQYVNMLSIIENKMLYDERFYFQLYKDSKIKNFLDLKSIIKFYELIKEKSKNKNLNEQFYISDKLSFFKYENSMILKDNEMYFCFELINEMNFNIYLLHEENNDFIIKYKYRRNNILKNIFLKVENGEISYLNHYEVDNFKTNIEIINNESFEV